MPNGEGGTHAGDVGDFLELVHGVCGVMVVVCGGTLRLAPPIAMMVISQSSWYGV